jgi:hypothetical protein
MNSVKSSFNIKKKKNKISKSDLIEGDLSAKITEFSKNGLVTVTFSNAIYVPNNFTLID